MINENCISGSVWERQQDWEPVGKQKVQIPPQGPSRNLASAGRYVCRYSEFLKEAENVARYSKALYFKELSTNGNLKRHVVQIDHIYFPRLEAAEGLPFVILFRGVI